MERLGLKNTRRGKAFRSQGLITGIAFQLTTQHNLNYAMYIMPRYFTVSLSSQIHY